MMKRFALLLVSALVCAMALAPHAAATRGGPAEAEPYGAAVDLDSPAASLRVTLGRLLSEHAFLTMEQMRAIASDAPDQEAAAAAVDANSSELSEAIGSVYGDDAASAFGELWQSHIDDLAAYAAAVRDGDDGAAEQARDGLDEFRSDLAAFLSAANPNLTAEGVSALLHLHTDQLTAYLENDFEAAFTTERQAFQHMFETGDTLASAIISQFPDRFPGARGGFSPAVSLWISLDRMLGEHLVLSAEAMRASRSGGEELEAARGALDDNSADLASAIAGIYGDEAGEAFGSLWGEHVDSYVAYIVALQDDDAAAVEQHRETMETYANRFGEFLAAANPHLSAGSVEDLIAHHTHALLEQVDAYERGDYEAAYTTVREAYRHMFDVGEALAAALSEQFPARFPALPASDTRSSVADVPARALPLVALVIGVLGLVGLYGTRRAAGRRL